MGRKTISLTKRGDVDYFAANGKPLSMNDTLDNPPSAGSGGRKRSIWFHLHFWIGWISAVPIALVCLTGAFLIFEGEIFRWEHKSLFQLEPKGTPLSIGEAIDRYRSATPPLQVNHLGIPKSHLHSFSAYCTEIRPEGNRGGRVFLNPYTGEFSRIGDGFSISHLLIDVHRHMAAGRTGQLIVAISSLVLAITCLIGLILWWPLRGRTFVRAWKRGQALDWHNALGLVALVPLIVMAITGICFTWNRPIFTQLEKLQGSPSRIENPVVVAPDPSDRVSIDSVIAQVQQSFPGIRITGIQPSNRAQSPHAFFLDMGGSNLRVYMNPYTGKEILRTDGFGTGPVGWLRSNFGKFHTLGPYNLFVRVLWGLLSFGGTVLVITGVWISVKRWRRSKGRA
jgi:sulfite reductase (NADPH) flavoprotein alpha-component